MHATRSRVPRQQRRESTMSLTAVSVYNCTHIGVIVGARRVCRQTHADTHRTKHTAERPYIIFFFLIYCWVAYTISLYTEPNRSRVWVFCGTIGANVSFCIIINFLFSRPLTKPDDRPSPSKHAHIINTQYLYNNNNTIVLRGASLPSMSRLLPRPGANYYVRVRVVYLHCSFHGRLEQSD